MVTITLESSRVTVNSYCYFFLPFELGMILYPAQTNHRDGGKNAGYVPAHLQ